MVAFSRVHATFMQDKASNECRNMVAAYLGAAVEAHLQHM